MEKRLAVVAMQQLYRDPLDICGCSSSIYFSLMQQICLLYENWYLDAHWDPLLVQLIEDVMRANQLVFSIFHPYPFCILDYQSSAAASALTRFMYEPTIPCGIRNIATKMRNGSLATPEELAYIENEVKLYTTHFRLYETIPPSK